MPSHWLSWHVALTWVHQLFCLPCWTWAVQNPHSVNVTSACVIHFWVVKRMWPLRADCGGACPRPPYCTCAYKCHAHGGYSFLPGLQPCILCTCTCIFWHTQYIVHTMYVCKIDLLLYLLKSWSSFFLSTAALGGSTKYRTGSVKKLSVAASILQSFSERQLMAVCSSVPVMVTNCRTLERWDCFNLCCEGNEKQEWKKVYLWSHLQGSKRN